MNAMSRFVTAVAVALVGMAPSFAFTMEPMSVLLGPSGPGSSATFRITNDGTARIAIKLSVWSRGSGPDGQETNAPADDRFALYPSRLVVEPGAFANVKLQWKGEAKPVAELPFRLVAEQVPLDGAGQAVDQGANLKSSGIKVLFRYIASVYVGDATFKPSLSASVIGGNAADGRKGLVVAIANSGNRHVVANDLRVEIQGLTAPAIEGASLGPLSGANYLPGTGRTIFVPSAEAVPGAIYEAKLSFDAEY